jgi:hypothetical protein
MAVPMPNAFSRSWASATRWMVAIAFLRIATGTTTDVGAAIVYSLVFWALLLVDAGRMSVGRLIAARAPAWRRMSG